jgi:hypothetical protein
MANQGPDRPTERAAAPYWHAANGVLQPIQEFCINGRWLYLYSNPGYTPSAPFSMYWEDEQNPLQHNMNHLEVFNVLSDLLKPAERPVAGAA